jgi:hypothetical protein
MTRIRTTPLAPTSATTRRGAIGIALALSLAFSLAACGGGEREAARADAPDDARAAAADSAAGAPADSGPAAATDSVAWLVRPDGIGPIRVGVPLAALGDALGERLVARYEDFEGCDFVRPKAAPPGVTVMVLNDTVARVDVDAAGVRTVEGAQVGDDEARVLELYRGRITVEPHKYTGPEGHYLVVAPPGDTLHRVIFETDGKRVTLYRAGRRPAVEFVEGCA